jgi:hypothetical protein
LAELESEFAFFIETTSWGFMEQPARYLEHSGLHGSSLVLN